MTTSDRFPTGSLTGSPGTRGSDWFPVPLPSGTGTSRTGSPGGSQNAGTAHLDGTRPPTTKGRP